MGYSVQMSRHNSLLPLREKVASEGERDEGCARICSPIRRSLPGLECAPYCGVSSNTVPQPELPQGPFGLTSPPAAVVPISAPPKFMRPL